MYCVNTRQMALHCLATFHQCLVCHDMQHFWNKF